MIASDSASRDIFKDLRQNLFFGEPMALAEVESLRAELLKAPDQQKFTVWRRLRALGVTPEATEAQEVLGVIMEVGLDDGAATLVFGLRDGAASVYHSTGGGHIGGQTRPHINAAARELTSLAAGFVRDWPLTEVHPLPGAGRVRFSILTPGGVYAAEEESAKMETEGDPLSQLFQAANEIITGFQMASTLQANDEAGYVRCLLTTLARGESDTAVVISGQPLMDPATLTSDAKEQEQIARLAFPFDRLSVKKVMAIVLRSAGFPRLQLGNGEHTMRQRVKKSGDTAEEVTFLVSRRKEQGQTLVEIKLQASGDQPDEAHEAHEAHEADEG